MLLTIFKKAGKNTKKYVSRNIFCSILSKIFYVNLPLKIGICFICYKRTYGFRSPS